MVLPMAFGNLKKFLFIVKRNYMEHFETKLQIRCLLTIQEKKKRQEYTTF